VTFGMNQSLLTSAATNLKQALSLRIRFRFVHPPALFNCRQQPLQTVNELTSFTAPSKTLSDFAAIGY